MSRVTAPNLTRDAAASRAAALTVRSYSIELDVTDGAGAPGEGTFDSRTTIVFDATVDETFVDLVATTVHRATLNGADVDVTGYRPEDGIALIGLAERNELVVHAACEYSHTGEGLHRFVDPVDEAVYLYTQFETADAKRMFACFDQPDLKATFDLIVTAPVDWQVISNSPVAATEGPRRVFETTKPLSTYLIALVAGPYAVWTDSYSDEHGTVPLGLYCRATLAEHMDAERMFTETKQGFAFYHANFGTPYPFGKYDQLFVPEFNAGAMENAGAVTILEDYVFRSRVTAAGYERRCETVLHELAHMWFGDLVTMRWWDDLWLNESFATYASVLCQANVTQYTNAWTTFANVEKSWAYRQDMLPSTHPIAADIPDLAAVEVNFDGITYAKGASVLKQLVAYVGQEDFLAGLRQYFTEHAYGNAEFADLLGALTEASGRDLSDWGDQWLRTTGLNTLRPSFTTDDDGIITSFAVEQGPAAPGAGELRTHRLAVGVYGTDNGTLVRTRRVELDVRGERTEVPELVGVHRGELVLVNDDDLTYCSLRLDPASLTTLTERIGDVTDPLARTLCWSAAWEMTREAELRARDFVALVLSGLERETEVGVLQRLLAQVQAALGSYAEPEWARSQGWPMLAGRVTQLARAAAPGSDHQLALVTALASSVIGDEEIELLRGLLDADAAEQGMAGLVVDTDLRWTLVAGLAANGALDAEGIETPEIDAEVRRDQTSAGARQGARARTARPIVEAKDRAWQQVLHDDQLSHTVGRAIIGGFSRAGQGELLEPFVGRYFDEVADVWARRSSEVAQAVVVGLFPSWSVRQSTVDAADAFLAAERPFALARLVIEGRAAVVRALAAREFDAS